MISLLLQMFSDLSTAALQQVGSLTTKAARRRRSTPPPAPMPIIFSSPDLYETASMQQTYGNLTALMDTPLQPDNLPDMTTYWAARQQPEEVYAVPDCSHSAPGQQQRGQPIAPDGSHNAAGQQQRSQPIMPDGSHDVAGQQQDGQPIIPSNSHYEAGLQQDGHPTVPNRSYYVVGPQPDSQFNMPDRCHFAAEVPTSSHLSSVQPAELVLSAMPTDCQNPVEPQGMQGEQVAAPVTAPEAGARALAGLDLHPQSSAQHPQRHAPFVPVRAHQSSAAAVGRPSSRGATSAAAALGRQATAQADSGSQNGKAVASNPPVAVRRGFGGILSGVVKEAAETATKRPPVFRYEDFKTVTCSHLALSYC